MARIRGDGGVRRRVLATRIIGDLLALGGPEQDFLDRPRDRRRRRPRSARYGRSSGWGGQAAIGAARRPGPAAARFPLVEGRLRGVVGLHDVLDQDQHVVELRGLPVVWA